MTIFEYLLSLNPVAVFIGLVLLALIFALNIWARKEK